MGNKSRDELLEQLGKFVIRKLRTLSASNIELNSINNKTTNIVSVLEEVNQQVIGLIELSSTEDNTSILFRIELVHKKLIELAELLIERGIDAHNEVSIVLRIEKQYLELVELAKSNLAESNRTNVIFAIKVMYGTIIEDIYYPLRGNHNPNFASAIKAKYQRLIDLMEVNLIEKNSKVFVPVISKVFAPVIEEKYYKFLEDYRPYFQSSVPPVPTIEALYKEIFGFVPFIPASKTLYEDTIITDKNIKKYSHSLVKGIFLCTDGDAEIVDYMMNNFEDFDELTGKWCYIYVLEKKGINWKLFIKYWKYLLLSELHEIFKPIRLFTKKPFNRNESYKIARDLGVPIAQLPCLVFLPPLTEISGQ
ncbi:MAG: hypothetical protein F6K25_04525 [Okeania sp. SIO2G4]|uniref:hypothetical protein n=1 Tax=unclassified Okeania TaxID=2634635 RepID=UPI0013BABBF8|nr:MULTISPECIES: hypothetical protein [unclassified Okeania]NEP42384.1 hypothetical protein [Okeania sp. SIO2H7]NEP71580.1 hypothetical protein [Okeania sp. SIO2G5]NEP92552.1 hypothetical protein [Okeania sp. SIO2F5]NEQ90034.1 hypothetical protein [Okeania sp. SIO2G4]